MSRGPTASISSSNHCNLAGVRAFVQPSLAARLELEMLDGVGHIDTLAIDPRLRERPAHFMENTNRGAATSARPTKNIELAAKWRSEIHRDRTKEMNDDRAGTNKKNIVTKPLSFSVAVKAI